MINKEHATIPGPPNLKRSIVASLFDNETIKLRHGLGLGPLWSREALADAIPKLRCPSLRGLPVSSLCGLARRRAVILTMLREAD
jgi:hypothetical protein